MAAESSLNLYYPEDERSRSKANWVLDALAASHGNCKKLRKSVDHVGTGVVWGLGQYYYPLVERWIKLRRDFIFTDMPYWNRFMGDNRSTCHWRIIPNALHCNWVRPRPSDRFDRLGIPVKPWQAGGEHVLVCPSSLSMERFYDEHEWTRRVVKVLRQHTKRPIKIRVKPRQGKRSGPMVESIPFAQDASGAWAVVTLCSITGVEAATLGIPVFCHAASPCMPIGCSDLSLIESPLRPSRDQWLNNLAYYQYTESELAAGTHMSILT